MSHSLRIKICGVTSAADAREAAYLGADAIGLNFYPPSPRYIDRQTAQAILLQLPPFVTPVGIFVNQPFPEIVNLARQIGRLDTVQWHGENPQIPRTFPLHWIAAFPVRDQQSLLAITAFLDQLEHQRKLPAAVLVDAHVPGQYGGTGQNAPWKLLADFNPSVPLILAGGLTTDNVAEAIRVVRPYGVDVASGVENSPGRKDREKMRRFIETARAAAATA